MSVKDDDFDGDEDGNGDNAMIENTSRGEKTILKDFQIETFLRKKIATMKIRNSIL